MNYNEFIFRLIDNPKITLDHLNFNLKFKYLQSSFPITLTKFLNEIYINNPNLKNICTKLEFNIHVERDLVFALKISNEFDNKALQYFINGQSKLEMIQIFMTKYYLNILDMAYSYPDRKMKKNIKLFKYLTTADLIILNLIDRL